MLMYVSNMARPPTVTASKDPVAESWNKGLENGLSNGERQFDEASAI